MGKDSDGKDSESKDSEGKDSEPKDSESKDSSGFDSPIFDAPIDLGPPDSPVDSPVDAIASTCPPASVPSSEVLPYVTVTPTLNACTSTQISGFVSACFGGTAKECKAWQNDKANATCQACFFPYDKKTKSFTNAGGVLLDYVPYFFEVNQPGCIALADPTHGPACAAALEPYQQCLDVACTNTCTTEGALNACLAAVAAPGGACNSYYNAVQAAPCATDTTGDGGVATECSLTNQASVLNVICGTGP